MTILVQTVIEYGYNLGVDAGVVLGILAQVVN